MPGQGVGDCASVVSVEIKGAAGEAGRIHLSDGSFFVLHAEIIAREGIAAGTSMDPERRTGLLSRSEAVFARARALALLSRAAHSTRDLARKLSGRGFSAAAVQEAVARMRELGYLDDRAFAEGWVRFRMSTRKEGWKALYRGLLRKGISRALAEEVVEAGCPFEEEMENARQLAAGREPQKVIRLLSARGFRSKAIARVLKELRGTGRRVEEE
jgi:regulatory protein